MPRCKVRPGAQRSRQAGWTLIEALVAFLLLALALLGLAWLQPLTLAASADSRLRTLALNASQSKLEELRLLGRYADFVALGAGSDSLSAAQASLERSWEVNACPEPSLNCREIRVSVTWVDAAGSPQTVRLVTLLAGQDPVRGGVALLPP